MAEVTIPEQPLTTEQRAQLRLDLQASIDARAPNYPDSFEIWSVLQGLLYLVNNPADPPESEPPPESP